MMMQVTLRDALRARMKHRDPFGSGSAVIRCIEKGCVHDWTMHSKCYVDLTTVTTRDVDAKDDLM
jgi:hypothetical protein